MDRGANIHHRDKRLITPLHFAASKGNIFAVELMHERINALGDEVVMKNFLNSQTKGKETPLTRAAKFNKQAMINRLIQLEGID